MQADNSIILRIADTQIEEFESFNIDSNLLEGADAFSVDLVNPLIKIKKGSRCRLYVNKRREFDGIIDKIEREGDKNKKAFKIEARSLLSLLVDSYVTDFEGLEDITLKELTVKLLKDMPYINRNDIIFDNIKDEKLENVQISPGKTIFQVLSWYAKAQGKLFYAKPNGTLVFTEPKSRGSAEYTLIRRKNGIGNNILHGKEVDNIEQQYKTVKIIGQRDCDDDETNFEGSAVNPDFPFNKTLVLTETAGFNDPARQAKNELKKREFEGYQLQYKTFGYMQNNTNFQSNTICKVIDEELEIEGSFLIIGRSFSFSRQGKFTNLRLSKLGRAIV